MRKIQTMYLPTDLDFVKLETGKLRVSFLKYIISVILKNNNLERRSPNSFTSLSSAILKEITYNYIDYIKFLIENDIIERGDSYRVGFSCKRVRLKPRIKEVKIEIITDKWILQRLHRSVTLSDKSCSQFPAPEFLNKWFDSRLTLDVNEIKLDGVKLNQTSLDILSRFDPNDFNLHRTPSTFRLYSNISTMPKELRNYLRFDGSPMVSLDLKNCHFFLISSLLLNKDFYETGSCLNETLLEESTSNCRKPNYIDSCIPPVSLISLLDEYSKRKQCIMYYRTLNAIDSSIINSINNTITSKNPYYVSEIYDMIKSYLDKADTKLFIKLSLSGRIYKELFEYIPELKQYNITAKKMMLTTLNGKPNSVIPYSRVIFNAFPSVFAIINVFKGHYYGIANSLPWFNENKPYASFSTMLQFFESLIIVDSVCSKISASFPAAPIFTIHDCILTTPRFVDRIEATILNQIEKLTGFKPLLSIDYGSNR